MIALFLTFSPDIPEPFTDGIVSSNPIDKPTLRKARDDDQEQQLAIKMKVIDAKIQDFESKEQQSVPMETEKYSG